MSRSRFVTVVVLAAVATSTPAFAAKPRPKPPICYLVKDEPSDANLMGQNVPALYDPSLEIVSFDIGVNDKVLTAVIRVKDLTKESQASPTGRTWNVAMSNGTSSLSLAAFISPLGGERFSSGKGVLDYANDQIRMHAVLADYPNAKIKKGSVLRGFFVTSNRVVGFDPAWSAGYAFAPFSTPVDQTPPTTASFPVGAQSCVKPGV